MSDGFYAQMPGAGEVFVHTNPTIEELCSSSVENYRRFMASAPRHQRESLVCLARSVEGGLAGLLGDLDPAVVERVAVVLASQVGGFLTLGCNPIQAVAAVGVGAMSRAGSINLEDALRGDRP